MRRRDRHDIRLVRTGRQRREGRQGTASEISRGFSELLSRMRFREESFVVETGGESVGEPAAPPRFTGAELVALLRTLPPVDAGYLATLEEVAAAQPRIE